MTATKPSGLTDEDLLREIEARTPKIDGCKSIQHAVVKKGPRTFKTASVMQFADELGEVTHHELRLNSYRAKRGGGFDFENREARWSCRDAEIGRLRTFLETYQGATAPGTHAVVPAARADMIGALLSGLGDAELSTAQLLDVVAALATRATDLRNLPELGEDNALRMVAAAIRVAHRSAALSRLEALVAEDATEQALQTLLDQNWWILGSHYVERIERRHWTTEETVDMLLRTADDYFDVVELKRASPALFKSDHSKWIVSSHVNDAVNQAAHYISEIERVQSYIFQRYGVDPFKLKAKVLIGRIDADERDATEKRRALRMYNSHLHRVEVITYDQLLTIGQNVVDANLGESGEGRVHDANGDVPF